MAAGTLRTGSHQTPPLHGRDAVVSRAAAALDGGGLIIHGPNGIGRTAVVDAACEAYDTSATLVRHAGGESSDRPGSAIQHLACEFPPEVLADLPTSTRALLLETDWSASSDIGQVQRAFGQLLWATAAHQRSAIVIDDINYFDQASIAAIRPPLRRAVADEMIGLVVTSTRIDELSPQSGEIPVGSPPPVPQLALEPLRTQDVVRMLAERGYPTQIALWAHRESGGIPGLAIALAQCAHGERAGIDPAAVHEVVRSRMHSVPWEIRPVLLALAVMHRPSVAALERMGIRGAALAVRQSVGHGLAVVEDDVVRLVPSGLGEHIIDESDPAEVVELHQLMAGTAPSSPMRQRHAALADPAPSDSVARELAHEAGASACTGHHDLAAELYLLAADRTTAQLDEERAEWLTRSIEEGVLGRSGRVLTRAVQQVWQIALDPSRSVRVKVSLMELEQQSAMEIDESLAAAVADARGEPLLLAVVMLQQAKMLLTTSDLEGSLAAATRSVELARSAGADEQLVEALTVAASVARSLGDPGARAMLDTAVATPTVIRPGTVHMSAPFIAARWSMYDDDLKGARSQLIELLATVGPDAGHDTVHVLRSLADVVSRQGKGRETLDLGVRTMRAVNHFALPATTGWYVEALAEMTGGSFERARAISQQGVDLAVEREDERYLRRHLAGLGAAQLMLGDLSAADTYRRLVVVTERAGLGDLTALRWHADAVTSLTAAGALDEASTVLERSRQRSLEGAGSRSVTAMLDRASADLLAVDGDLETARELATESAETLVTLGQPIEAARSWVTLGVIERRCRRVSASREAFDTARALVDADGPWGTWVAEREHRHQLTETHDQRPDGNDVHAPVVADLSIAGLSAMEQQVAREVALGRSNREIAARLHLSVKTVEGTLTRSYRKLGIRSRTQLATYVLAQTR